jgi:hypothetical protein
MTMLKKKKAKRKLRKLTSIMPMLEWRPDLSQLHTFRMPFQVGGMKNLQLYTPIKSRKKYVWANVYQKLSYLPSEIYMKDIQFGFIPRDHYGDWNTDEHNIVWTNEQTKIFLDEIKGLTLRGTAITISEWQRTYNPYDKFNKFIIDILRNNTRVQMSLPSIMQRYKDSGVWEEIKRVKKEIWNITTSDTLMDMWNYFTWNGHTRYDGFGKQFIVPNPIKSVRICIEGGSPNTPHFNFLLSKDTMYRHQLLNYIKSTPKSIPQEQMDKKINEILDTPHTYGHSEQGIDEENDRLNTQERQSINQYISDEEWDRDPVLLEEDDSF